ncbi:MAG: class I SAM-dependent methyltransferase, partial [Bacilli bacterium]
MNDYQSLKEFWNRSFQSLKPEKLTAKWVEDEGFNKVISASLKRDSKVLDFGCGSGWGLFELYFTQPFAYGLGIDQSESAIKCDQEVAILSQLDKLHFMVGDELKLLQFPDYFDFILSVNTIDVVPDKVSKAIINNLSLSLANGG